ncbi:MAG TPA: hypothetical protein VKA64_08970 [Gammaproteobacteria bacterium]|nr:hypothetical protein [Gammaproteobacteria bacterium]
MRAEDHPQPITQGWDHTENERKRRLQRQRHGAPSPLAVEDEALHDLLARAGQGGTY